ncbi:TPA: ATP-binding protein, partial [Acinetobacter baumannii]|nr:ATP-binding protein [Acinetobacter baumannii]
NYFPEIFEDITDAYQDIFPYVEQLKIEKQLFTLKNDSDETEFGQDILMIKESGISEWISHDEMSSGMLKTFVQLAYLYLSPTGTIFLIDEFENGFGVNCINSISQWLVNPEFNHQFIITSHHPYIINNISPKRWKIISRNSNKILSYDTSSVLDCSSHEAFIKLINLPLYNRGASYNK